MTGEIAISEIRKRICCEGQGLKRDDHFCTDVCLYGSDLCPISIAIEAIEYHVISKKISEIHCDYYICPKCGSYNHCHQHIVSDLNCPNCGQKINML